MTLRRYVDGSLRRWEDDGARLIHTYLADGSEMLPPVAYTAEQNAAADARAALEAAEATKDAARAAVKAIVADLKLEKDALDLVLAKTPAQITGGDTKAVAKSAKRIADAAIDLAKLVG